MKKILYILAACAIVACTKEEVKPENTNQPQNIVSQSAFYAIKFRNFTSMELNYLDGCESNWMFSGTTRFLTSGTDTICSFKIDADGIVSWKARPGHIVTLGGCPTRSLTIHQ